METRVVRYGAGQVEVEISVTDSIAKVIDAINETGRGQFGFIKNHVSGEVGKDKCIRPKVSDMWFLTNPRYDRWLARKREAVTALDVETVAARSSKLWDKMREKAGKNADITALFEKAKKEILDSVAKTEAGDRSDGHREGHDRCYVRLGNVTIHLATAPDSNGLMAPVRDERGRMIAEGCMLPFYAIKRVYSDEGEYGKVDSRALTLMKKAIEKATCLHDFKTFNLAKANFTTITFNSKTVFGYVRDSETAVLDTLIVDLIRDIGGLATDPLAVLRTEAQEIVNVMATVNR